MRSSAAIDASKLAGEAFGGGGHARAAGFRVRAFENFQLQVLQCIEKLKQGIIKQKKEDDEPAFASGLRPAGGFAPVQEQLPSMQRTIEESQPISQVKQTDIVGGLGESSKDSGETDIVSGLQ
jgi:hypothetical protein